MQARSPTEAQAAVLEVGGTITHELGIIDGVAATLSPAQAETLRANTVLTLSADAPTKVAGYAGQPYQAVEKGFLIPRIDQTLITHE